MPGTALNRSTFTFASMLVFGAAACASDRIAGTPTQPPAAAQDNLFTAHSAFQRYVAIGTSISAGVQSDGLIAATQLTSWPAQLAGMAFASLKQPYIGAPGCRSPIIAPLLLETRLSGESAAADAATLSCAPLLAGVTAPFDNVALNGALASDALNTTPQNIVDLGNAKIYSRVLQPGMTQVTTMLARNPTLVSVELGANEVLGATSGIAIPGGSLTKFSDWMTAYDKVLDSVQKATKTAVLVGLIDNLADVQAFRTGNDLWQDALEFALFNVAVSGDCKASQNLIFVPFDVPLAIGNGLARAQHNLGPFTLSCTDGGPLAVDFILTPAEVGIVNAQMAAMSAHIQLEAAARGFAYFALGALYDAKSAKAPFSLVKALTSPAPFGPYFSLDGIHPNAAGQAVLARAAAQALNAKYGLGIPIL